MGLFGIVGDIVGEIKDMKSLGNIQGEIEEAVAGLISSGKCPEELAGAFHELKETTSDAKMEDSMATLKKFAKALTDNQDKLPEEIRDKAEKFGKLAEDLTEKAEDMQKFLNK